MNNKTLNVLLLASAAALCCGCASSRCGQRHLPLQESAVKAFLSMETALPLAAAGILAVTGQDRRLSGWISDHTFLFGSAENADRCSNDLVAAAGISNAASLLGVPGVRQKASFLVMGMGIKGARDISVTSLKQSSRRNRPDESDLMSFPSGHAASAASDAAITVRNMEFSGLPDTTKNTVRAGVVSLAMGTAWARVEARKHYLTDVLVGAALGCFFSNLVYDSFTSGNDCRISTQMERDRVSITADIRFE